MIKLKQIQSSISDKKVETSERERRRDKSLHAGSFDRFVQLFNEDGLNHHEQLMLIELLSIHEFHAEEKKSNE